MRILLTADPAIAVPPQGYGGIERIVDGLARRYRDLGHSVGLMAHPGSTCEVDARFGWPAESGLVSTVRNAAALSQAVGRFEPDLVHSFSRLGYLAPLLPRRLPKVMSYQRHTGGRQLGWASRLAGRTLAFTGCSEFICAMGRPHGGDWSCIHNFVDIGRIDYQARVQEDAPLVFLSRLESIKGPDLAISIARASGRRLILAGNRAKDGPELAFWEQRIAGEIGKGRVEWIGEVGDAQKNELLGRAAALVVPIQWDEPFGIVFAEALAAGTPVITCARGAAPEIIEPGVTGFFVQDAAQGAAAVARLNEIDRGRCRACAEARFSLNACASQYLDLYARLLR